MFALLVASAEGPPLIIAPGLLIKASLSLSFPARGRAWVAIRSASSRQLLSDLFLIAVQFNARLAAAPEILSNSFPHRSKRTASPDSFY
jgi:hypothetical protein